MQVFFSTAIANIQINLDANSGNKGDQGVIIALLPIDDFSVQN
jgi:hypothetical protein